MASESSSAVKQVASVKKRSPFSSKTDKYKQRTKYNFRGSSSEYDTDSDRGERKSPISVKKNAKIEESKSGYSSENESDYEIIDSVAKDSPRIGTKASPALRQRKSPASRHRAHDKAELKETEIKDVEHEKPTEEQPKEKSREAELKPKHDIAKESDVSTGSGGSTDEFWKPSDSMRKEKQKKKERSKLEKPRSQKVADNVKSSKHDKKPRSPKYEEKLKRTKPGFYKKFLGFFGIMRHIYAEWRKFKVDYAQEYRSIKLLYNRCLMGLLIIFIFSGIGGIIFRSTEGAFETFYKCGVKRVKRDFLDALWEKRYLREEDWKSLARTKLMDFENQLYDAYEAGMTSYSGQKGWSFINSIVYVLTVITTIGYGHMAPKTTLGRIATIVYSLFGIPMFLILLADYGKLFTRGIKFLWAFVRRLYYTGSCRKVRRTVPVQEMMKGMQLMYDMTKRGSTNKDEMIEVARAPQTARISPTETPAMSAYIIDDEFNLPISVAFSILVTYMIGGAMFFHYTEGWDYIVSFYYVYISISTIGFGDFVPKSQVILMLISLVYFVFGLSLTSMCINVIQEKLSDSFKQASAKLGATIGFQVDEEGNAVPVALADDEQPDAIVTEEEENKVEGNQDP